TPPAPTCNLGEDRKVFFVHHDPTKHPGWPIAIDANGDGLIDGGGEPPPHMVDLDGDNVMELVQATAAGRIYAFRADGSQLPGILGSPVLADLDGDGFLDIVVAAMDQHVYAWDRRGSLLPGWPVKIQDPAPGPGETPVGAESINTPVVADLAGDGHLEVVIETNEVYRASGNANQFFPNEQNNPTSVPGRNTGTVP